jgi:hypothetical protein
VNDKETFVNNILGIILFVGFIFVGPIAIILTTVGGLPHIAIGAIAGLVTLSCGLGCLVYGIVHLTKVMKDGSCDD